MGGLILDAPYTSIVELGAAAYPFLPVKALLIDRYETTKYIAAVKVPLLIMHGELDSVVPVAMGRELARLANEPKRLVTFADGGHTIDGDEATDAMRAWIGGLRLE